MTTSTPTLRTAIAAALLGVLAPTVAVAAPADVAATVLLATPVHERRAPVAPRAAVADPSQVVPAVLAAVMADGGVPVDDAGTPCAPDDLRVRWAAPGIEHGSGAWIEPLGPAPDAATTHANGIVTCNGSVHTLVGFEVARAGNRWSVATVPAPDGEHDDAHPDDHGHHHEDGAGPAVPALLVAMAAPSTVRVAPALQGRPAAGAPIDAYARHEPQTTCVGTPQPGTLALRDHLLTTYPGTRNMGLLRGCEIGAKSEHKDGRAFDWGVDATRTKERAAAEDWLADLLATDSAGNAHALARRMGVMYVIWDRRIWSAYAPDAGWRAYSGASPHRDHVHISLSWDGARGRTSFWSGTAVTGTPPPGGGPTNDTGGSTGGTGGEVGGGATGGDTAGGGKTGGGKTGGGKTGGGKTGGGKTGGGKTGGGKTGGTTGGGTTGVDRDREPVGPPPTLGPGVEPGRDRIDPEPTDEPTASTTRARRWRGGSTEVRSRTTGTERSRSTTERSPEPAPPPPPAPTPPPPPTATTSGTSGGTTTDGGRTRRGTSATTSTVADGVVPTSRTRRGDG